MHLRLLVAGAAAACCCLLLALLFAILADVVAVCDVAAIVVGCLQLGGGGGPCDKSINCLPKPVPGPTAKADRNERLATLAFVTLGKRGTCQPPTTIIFFSQTQTASHVSRALNLDL